MFENLLCQPAMLKNIMSKIQIMFENTMSAIKTVQEYKNSSCFKTRLFQSGYGHARRS